MQKKDLHDQMRQKLIHSAVKTVADFGMEGAKTRAIASVCGINESYIYRYFIDRDDLLEKAFIQADTSFFDALESASLQLRSGPERRSGFRNLVDEMLDFAIRNMDCAKFYMRYYYSASYTQNAMLEHEKTAHAYAECIRHFFKPDINIDAMCHALFVLMHGFLMEISAGICEDSAPNRDLLFDMMLAIIRNNLEY